MLKFKIVQYNTKVPHKEGKGTFGNEPKDGSPLAVFLSH